MLSHIDNVCKVCGSRWVYKYPTYKRNAWVCSDCNCVAFSSNFKHYLLERLWLHKVLTFLPRKAFARLFHAHHIDLSPSDFYSVYIDQINTLSPARESEIDQLHDQLSLAGFSLDKRSILDISCAPGHLVRGMRSIGLNIEFTEFNPDVVAAISNATGARGYVFDYANDKLTSVLSGKKYDVILIRSSIIFCPSLSNLLLEIVDSLNPDGLVLVETIVPTLGEILWWQQLEFVFPRIYSQKYIEGLFLANNFTCKLSYRNVGSYLSNKWRGRSKGLGRFLFTWIIELPMVALYHLFNYFRHVPISPSLHHKMLTQIWQYSPDSSSTATERVPLTIDFPDSDKYASTHFTRTYNGYLRLSK